MRPLDGITVVSLEQAVAAPFATRQLADLGARVIKIERPVVGDFARDYDERVQGLSSYFTWINRSKESVTLNVKHPDGMDVLRKLIADVDVFVQNLAPGATTRLGIGSTMLRESHPRLITIDLSGYGSSGPYRDKKAYDMLIQSEVGALSVTGTDDAPARMGISVADIAGGMYAYTAALTALFHRERTGEGSHCEVSLFDALSEWMGHPMFFGLDGDASLQRSGDRHSSIAPYGPFRTADTPVVISIQNKREWESLCANVLENSALATDKRFATNPLRVEHRDDLQAVIEGVFTMHTSDVIVARLESAAIANARMQDVAGLIAHPQHAERNRWQNVASPVGDIAALVPPVEIAGQEPRMDAIPAIGEHTDDVLRELGYDGGRIAELRSNGTV